MNRFPGYLVGYEKYRAENVDSSMLAVTIINEFAESVFDVKVNGDVLEFSCFATKSEQILKLLSQNSINVKRIYVRGIAANLKKALKRPGIIVGLLIALFILKIQNRVVWKIEISGNDVISSAEIEENLSAVGFAVGKTYDKNKISAICNQYILNDDRVSWISVNMSGNVAFVEIKERTKKENTDKLPSYSGIIASKDCVIERPEVFCGTSLVQKGQTVEKGQMIISPIEFGTDGKEYISGAVGKIIAKTYNEFYVKIPYETVIENFEEIPEFSYTLNFLGHKIRIGNKSPNNSENKLFVFKNENVKLFGKIELPINAEILETRKYVVTPKTLGAEEAKKKAYRKMYSKIADDLSECEILSMSFSENEEENGFVLRCKTECLENVAVKKR